MNYTAIYFSPTGTSEKSVVSITGELAEKAERKDFRRVNLTTYAARETKVKFFENDFVVFGTPVYGGRIPKVAAQRLRNISGKQTPCIVTVTYGNRDYDDALLELADLVKSNGFVVQAAAALVGQHTFGEIQVGRPNASDEKENQQFAKNFLEALKKVPCKRNAKLPIKGNRPYVEGGNGGTFRPHTDDTCTKCGLCVKNCPVGAIASDCSTINSKRCISCFRCIRCCPSQSKNMNDANYIKFAKEFSQKLSVRRENEYFLPQK